MAIKITIIGLGQIGTSIGLALANQKNALLRVGHDREPTIARRSKSLGAVDHIEFNLYKAVEEASVVILALPADQIHETLSLIVKDLKEGAVVLDTAPVKGATIGWVNELLPEGRYYVGLTPGINPAYLNETKVGIEAAHADLFHNGLIAITTPGRSNSEAIQLATDLVRFLGAAPLFADPNEMDGVMAAIHLLPQLMAAALLLTTTGQPGWREGQKLAGRSYTNVSDPMTQTDPKALRAAALHNRQNVMRLLDLAIAALQALHNDISEQNGENLDLRLQKAREVRDLWWRQRQAADWLSAEMAPKSELPTASEIFGRLIGLGRRSKPGK